MMGLPKGLGDVAETVSEFKTAMDQLNARLDIATDAMVAGLIGEHGTDEAARLLESARSMREALGLTGEADR